MRIGLGLPNAVPKTDPADLLRWAVMAGQTSASCLATTDRLVFDSLDSLTTLAAVAAVSDKPLLTGVLLAPLQANTALFAKQAATVDRLCGGRLTLGLAVGSRPDDFRASGVPFATRGRAFDRQLDELAAIWAGERRGFAGGIGPEPGRGGGPEIVVGGQAPRALARAAQHGTGWISGGGGPDMFRAGASRVREAWEAAGRTDRPRLLALAYYAVGDGADRVAASYLRDYYGFAPPYAQAVVAQAAVGTDGLTRVAESFEAAGCDELLLVPCSSDLAQLSGVARWLESQWAPRP